MKKLFYTLSFCTILQVPHKSMAAYCDADKNPEGKLCVGCKLPSDKAAGQVGELNKLIGQKLSNVSVYKAEVSDGAVGAMSQQASIGFQAEDPVPGLATFDLDADNLFQSMEGYGASLTESCVINLQKLDPVARREAMQKIFSKENGAGLDYLRLPMGASDFADSTQGSYTYNDSAGNKPDPKFTKFSMARDEKSFEIIREARKINPNLRVLISPWTAPAWMKTTKRLHGGELSPKHYKDFANYFVKVIREYEARGVPVDSLTIQNEPAYVTDTYPSMGISTKNQAKFIREYLGPALAREKLKVRIFAHDHNWDLAKDFVQPLLEDKKTSRYLGGVAYHCYGGDETKDMYRLVKEYPKMSTFMTECTGSLGSNPVPDFQWWMDEQVLGATKKGTTGALGWNLCLDEQGGPRNGGCEKCRGLVTVDLSKPKPTVQYNPEFHAMAQISRFIKPGSRRIDVRAQDNANPQVIGFRNPDGALVVVAQNRTGQEVQARIRRADCSSFTYTVPPYGAVTFSWNPS